MSNFKKNIRCPKCDGTLRREREVFKTLTGEFKIPNTDNCPTCIKCGSKYELKIKYEGILEIGYIEI